MNNKLNNIKLVRTNLIRNFKKVKIKSIKIVMNIFIILIWMKAKSV